MLFSRARSETPDSASFEFTTFRSVHSPSNHCATETEALRLARQANFIPSIYGCPSEGAPCRLEPPSNDGPLYRLNASVRERNPASRRSGRHARSSRLLWHPDRRHVISRQLSQHRRMAGRAWSNATLTKFEIYCDLKTLCACSSVRGLLISQFRSGRIPLRSYRRNDQLGI